MKKNQCCQHGWNILKVSMLVLMLSPMVVLAQSVYKLSSGGNLKVLGSSNVHDWTMATSAIDSQGTFKFNGRELTGVTGLNFSVLAKSLKSGKPSMDSRTYKTLKAEQFSKISYQLKSAEVSKKGEKYLITTTGSLTIAGVTKQISMLVTADVDADKSIVCHGSEKIKLTDFAIAPPSFVLGAMKVGNEVVIQFDLTYSK